MSVRHQFSLPGTSVTIIQDGGWVQDNPNAAKDLDDSLQVIRRGRGSTGKFEISSEDARDLVEWAEGYADALRCSEEKDEGIVRDIYYTDEIVKRINERLG